MAKKASSRQSSSAGTKKTAKKAVKKAVKKKTAKKPAAKKAVKKTAKKAVKKTAKKAAAKKPAPAAKAEAPKPAKPKRKTRTMPKAERMKFREMLLEKRRAIIGDMSGIEAETLGRGGGNLSNMPTHAADLGTDNYEHEFSLGLLESERALLGEIDQALGRVENGTFGICMGTGERIGKPRLRARPWAKYCIDHARKIEQGLIRPGAEDVWSDGDG